MDDASIGRLVRVIRRRAGHRQLDLARSVGVSQKLVSLFEQGQLEAMSLRSVRRIGSALGVRLPFAPWWRGGDVARLLDAQHAAMVEQLAATMRTSGWTVVVEFTFSHYGERGSIDVLGWRADGRALLIVEVKSRIVDIQALVAGLDRKARLAPRLVARDRGWRPVVCGRVVVAADSTANRTAVAAHSATFAAALPQRSREARRWLRAPIGDLAAVWFLSLSNRGTGPRHPLASQRVRRSNAAAAAGDLSVAGGGVAARARGGRP